MKYKDHITSKSFYWRRCKKVDLEGETACWELENEKYDIIRAYEQAPHRIFLQAEDDDLLLAFLKSWGPLEGDFSTDLQRLAVEVKGRSVVRELRYERDMLRWTVKLFASIETLDTANQRALLMEFKSLWEDKRAYVLAERANWTEAMRIRFPEASRYPSIPFRLPGTPAAKITDRWIATASPEYVEELCHGLLNEVHSEPKLGYALDRGEDRCVVRGIVKFTSLADALRWMLWQDLFQGHPLRFCAECPKLIENSSRHDKKFCSPICASRKTAREWQRRKRANEGASNGTH